MIHRGRTGPWHIAHDPPPIPRSCGADYQFWHEDYDGALEHSEGPPADHRCGAGASIASCIARISDMEDE